jgi:hypothetical protein
MEVPVLIILLTISGKFHQRFHRIMVSNYFFQASSMPTLSKKLALYPLGLPATTMTRTLIS